MLTNLWHIAQVIRFWFMWCRLVWVSSSRTSSSRWCISWRQEWVAEWMARQVHSKQSLPRYSQRPV